MLWHRSNNQSMDEDYFLERLKLFFDGNKHLSTLGVVTLLLLFTIDGRSAGDAVATEPALIFYGLSLLLSLFGVFVGATMENFAKIYEGTPGKWCFAGSALLFLAGVLFAIVLPVLT